MKKIIIYILKKTLLYNPLKNWATKREIAEWEKKGKPVPPPHAIKQRALREYSKKYNIRILIETGTHLGDMVEAMRTDFERIYSIELSKELYERAVMRFKGADNVELIQGDSGSELKKILDRIQQPAIFWLDGHYSGGVTAIGASATPVLAELRHILDSPYTGHVIIIDDARCFGKDPSYPSMNELSKFIISLRPNVDIVVQDDSIRITPKTIAA
jgi:hypothetical protein